MFLKKIPVKAQKTGLKVSKDKKEGVNEIGFLTIKKLFQVNEGPVFVCFDFIFLRRKMVLTPDGRGGSRPQRLGLSLSKPARTMSVGYCAIMIRGKRKMVYLLWMKEKLYLMEQNRMFKKHLAVQQKEILFLKKRWHSL